MSPGQDLWIGYCHDGGRTILEISRHGNRAVLLGSRSRDLASIIAVGAKEAGLAPMIFDLDGSLAMTLSGHFDTYDYRSFLYDSFRLEQPEPWHSQLAASAYTTVLDLSSEEEAIINSAMQVVASDGTLLSPVSLHDVMGKVEGFRGFHVDKLNGKVGALRLFDAVDDQSFDVLIRGNLIIDFHSAPYPQAAELSFALFLAKVLAMGHSKGSKGGFLLATEVQRVFKALPRAGHSNRLLANLLSWPGTTVLSAEQPIYLDPLLFQSCLVRIYSSDAWHAQPRRVQRTLSGSFVLHDFRDDKEQFFVPRRIPTKTATYASGRAAKYPSPDLARLILEEVERFPLCTPDSVVQYIAPEFLPADISAALVDLQSQGCLILEPKDSGMGPRVFAYTLSEKGRSLLQELRN